MWWFDFVFRFCKHIMSQPDASHPLAVNYSFQLIQGISNLFFRVGKLVAPNPFKELSYNSTNFHIRKVRTKIWFSAPRKTLENSSNSERILRRLPHLIPPRPDKYLSPNYTICVKISWEAANFMNICRAQEKK